MSPPQQGKIDKLIEAFEGLAHTLRVALSLGLEVAPQRDPETKSTVYVCERCITSCRCGCRVVTNIDECRPRYCPLTGSTSASWRPHEEDTK